LNAYGEAFRRNGYQLPAGGDEDGIKQKPIEIVAAARSALFPDSDFPSDLAAALPIAFIVRGLVPTFPDPKTRPNDQSALSFDQILVEGTFVGAVRFGDNVALYTGMTLSTATGFQFERGFVAISNVVHDGALNFRIGQFEPQVLSFSDYRRLAGAKYWILVRPGTTYGFAFDPAVRGVDLNGILGGRLGYNLAWVQGIEPLSGSDPRHQLPRDGYVHLYGKIGGAPLDAVDQRGGGLDHWLTLGGFGYVGRHDVNINDAAPATRTEGDFFYKVGGDANSRLGRVDLLVAAAYERHALERTGLAQRIQGLAECDVSVFPWLVAGVRAEMEVPQRGFAQQRISPVIEVYPRINLKAQVYAQIVHDEHVNTNLHAAEVDFAATAAF
jgi:hypothetical protein